MREGERERREGGRGREGGREGGRERGKKGGREGSTLERNSQGSPPHLLGRAEDVGVVLLEPPHPDEPSEGTRELVSVQHAKVGHPQRKLSP